MSELCDINPFEKGVAVGLLYVVEAVESPCFNTSGLNWLFINTCFVNIKNS